MTHLYRAKIIASVLLSVLLLFCHILAAQQPVRTAPTPPSTAPESTPTPTPTTPEPAPPSTRTRELGDQLRRSMSSSQQRSRRTQDTARQGLLTRNLTGMETFGDALGSMSLAGGELAVVESFTFNQSMFTDSEAWNTGMFTTNLQALTGGPKFTIQQQTGGFTMGNNTVALTTLPANLANTISTYLGQVAAGTARDFSGGITFSDALVEFVRQYGVDALQLTLDPSNSSVSFDYNGGIPVTLNSGQLTYSYVARYKIPVQPTGGGIYGLGRQKITENMTPVPTDRVFFDYSYYHNVPIGYGDMTVNRFTPGFEKTFWNKRFSVEMRLPFATTMDNELFTDNGNRTGVTRLGDMTMFLKWLLIERERFYLTVGLGLSVPLAEDMHLYSADSGQELIRWQNETCHLMPYVGVLYVPNDRIFMQGYFQVDASAHGDSTFVRDLTPGSDRMLRAGKSYERTYAYTSLGLGYWLHRSHRASGRIKNGINLVGEIHWTQSLDRGKGVHFEQDGYHFDIGNITGSYSVLNMTVGSRIIYNEKNNLGIGYAFPLSNGDRKQFDGELRLTYNRYF